MLKFIKTISFFAVVISITLLVLLYIQPYLYRVLPSDYQRHMILQDYFSQNSKTAKGEILIFGASETMFGIDSRIIKKDLDLTGEAYNLSSVGQSMYEASYYYTRITDNTKLVIQCSTPMFFAMDWDHYLSNEVSISMYLSGYRINDSTKKLIPNYNHFFNKPEIYNLFLCRTYFRSYIHNLIRPFFDNEVFEENVPELYFANGTTIERHPNYPVYPYDCSPFKFKEKPNHKLNFINKIVEYFNNKNIKYVIILMPVNPDLCSECYDDFNKYTDELRKIKGLYVINITHLLEPRYFYDGYHANKNGAKLISKEISKQLKLLHLTDYLK